MFKNRKARIVSVNANVKIINRKGQIIVLCHKLPFMQYYERDLAAQKVAIIQLYPTGFAEQNDQMNQSTGRFLIDVNNLGGRTLHKFQLKFLFDLEFEE